MRRSEIRDHLLDIALRLFNQHGYHATGIDLIIAEARVAKTTLYRHFETKEDLILAALERRDEEDRSAMRAFVEQHASDSVERLLTTFDFLEASVRDKQFRGCMFVSAAGEHKDTVNPVFRAAVMHKRLVIAYFEELAHAAQFAEPKRIATEINLLHEGAMAVAQMTRMAEPARQAKRMAQQLLPAKQRSPLTSGGREDAEQRKQAS
ncbi:putative transcriptional regulator, TetR family (plasmid) [Sinorhizobium fredii NGR234]|uniref:Transcriptional regulator, TetR family n=1 Tax=Sinorhizobium fredii (strain NBRC 101917 / NGR234) TaxID=394 RepID=Q6W172_SINFN|nr:TetR/AcrR family transcriptional regulator [Sinorhizobium fredii]AAQ87496.1 Transcriptional regulator, TetR family [Sinorhizobium fredii NGR234]ACP22033.1 putative transcriptional regulator, TetR family [Sinorhizobium fredii NGR234]